MIAPLVPVARFAFAGGSVPKITVFDRQIESAPPNEKLTIPAGYNQGMERRFYFDGRLAGSFLRGYPRTPGCYPYEPYGDDIHARMRQRLLDRGAVECYYESLDGRVFFSVVACVIPRLLEVNSFYRVPSEHH